MPKKRSLQQIKQEAVLFASCKNLDDLQNQLQFSKNNMIIQGLQPKYYHFEIKKAKGGTRKIEAPNHQLKEIQRKLNYYLQAIYYLNQTDSAYGYIITPKNKRSKKNIVSNAKLHLNCRHMINVDFKNFFHQIKQDDIINLFLGDLFSFDKKTARQLSKLCLYNNRLPMGAPTSPVLSNIYTIGLDKQLKKWADHNDIKYSRFVDDLTFSSIKTPFTQEHFNEIQKICDTYHLNFNTSKTRFLKPKDLKIVTGLLLSKTVDIHPDFYKSLNKDIIRLNKIYEASVLTNNLENNLLLKQFKQEVFGQISFIRVVEGYNSALYKDYKNKYKQALVVDNTMFSKRWVNFSYH